MERRFILEKNILLAPASAHALASGSPLEGYRFLLDGKLAMKHLIPSVRGENRSRKKRTRVCYKIYILFFISFQWL